MQVKIISFLVYSISRTRFRGSFNGKTRVFKSEYRGQKVFIKNILCGQNRSTEGRCSMAEISSLLFSPLLLLPFPRPIFCELPGEVAKKCYPR
jgi:hypothetical protein